MINDTDVVLPDFKTLARTEYARHQEGKQRKSKPQRFQGGDDFRTPQSGTPQLTAQSPNILHQQALEYCNNNQPEDAIQLLQTILNNPNTRYNQTCRKRDVQYSLARCYAIQERHQEAISLYQSITEKHSDFVLAYISMGRSMEQAGYKRKTILNHYKRAQEKFPEHKLLSNTANWYRSTGQKPQFTASYSHRSRDAQSQPKESKHMQDTNAAMRFSVRT